MEHLLQQAQKEAVPEKKLYEELGFESPSNDGTGNFVFFKIITSQ